jgi:predicted ester cyclase
LFLGMAFGHQTIPKEGIIEEDARALLDSALKAFNEGNLALIEQVWGPEYVLHDPSYPEGLVGLDALRKAFMEESKIFPDKKLIFKEMAVKGDKIFASFIWTGTHSSSFALPGGEELPATGKKLSTSGAYIGRVANGKIAEEWFFYNPLDMLLPLGYILTPPQSHPKEQKEEMEKLNELFTLQSLLSLQGAAAAALLVPNVLIYLFGAGFKPYKKWASFMIAMGLACLTAVLAPTEAWTKWLIAIFNGFLIFASAVGVNEVLSRSTGLGRKRFFASWF